jgi:hypothetical protein
MSGYGRPPFNSTLLFKQPSLALRQVIQFADPDPTEATVQGNWFWGVTDVIVRPSSDVTTTGWTAYPDPPLYAKIDEVTPDDNDYITSPDLNSTPGPAIFGISSSLVAGSYDVRFRARRTSTSGQARVSLLDSSNVSQGTSGWVTLTASFAQYTASVTTTGTATRVRIEVQP